MNFLELNEIAYFTTDYYETNCLKTKKWAGPCVRNFIKNLKYL